MNHRKDRVANAIMQIYKICLLWHLIVICGSFQSHTTDKHLINVKGTLTVLSSQIISNNSHLWVLSLCPLVCPSPLFQELPLWNPPWHTGFCLKSLSVRPKSPQRVSECYVTVPDLLPYNLWETWAGLITAQHMTDQLVFLKPPPL